jgi:hypothetical protein
VSAETYLVHTCEPPASDRLEPQAAGVGASRLLMLRSYDRRPTSPGAKQRMTVRCVGWWDSSRGFKSPALRVIFGIVGLRCGRLCSYWETFWPVAEG